MQRKSVLVFGLVMMILVPFLFSTGCTFMSYGPSLGIFSVPVPVSPYFQQQQEDQFWYKERYKRVKILDPLVPGAPDECLDPPSDDMVMVALEKARPVNGGVPFLHEIQRNNVRIVKEKISDFVDEPRFYPGLGMCQKHTVHYQCTVFFTEVTRVGWPVPYTTVNEDCQERLQIDLDHLHRCAGETGVAQQ